MSSPSIHDILPADVVEKIIHHADTKSAFRFLATSRAGAMPSFKAIANTKAVNVTKAVISNVIESIRRYDAIFDNEAQANCIMKYLLKLQFSTYEAYQRKVEKGYTMSDADNNFMIGRHEIIDFIAHHSETNVCDVQDAWRDFINGKPIPHVIYEQAVRCFQILRESLQGKTRRWKATINLSCTFQVISYVHIYLEYDYNGDAGATKVNIQPPSGNMISFMFSDENLTSAVELLHGGMGGNGGFMQREVYNFMTSIVRPPSSPIPLPFSKFALLLCESMQTDFTVRIK